MKLSAAYCSLALVLAILWGVTATAFGLNGLAFSVPVFFGAMVACGICARAVERS